MKNAILIFLIICWFPQILTAQLKVGKNPTNKSSNSNFESESLNGNRIIIDANNSNVGIGITTPSKPLEVLGVAKMDTLILVNNNAASGRVLTSDNIGKASWQNLIFPSTIAKVNILPSTNLDGDLVYLNGAGYYRWSKSASEWQAIFATDFNNKTINASTFYTSSNALIPITPIYTEQKFDLSFFANCYSRVGRVIGTVSPSKITVEKFYSFYSDGQTDELSQVQNNGTSKVTLGNGAFFDIQLAVQTNTFHWISYSNACGSSNKLSSGTISSLNNQGDFILWEKNPSTGIHYNLGKVGIGTSSPTESLDIVGNIHYSGDIIGLSDKRMKKNIEVFADGLQVIEKLNPMKYQYIFSTNSSEKYVGLLAQEVQKVAPYLVKNIESKDLLAVKYTDILLLLVNSVKELSENNQVAKENLKKARKKLSIK